MKRWVSTFLAVLAAGFAIAIFWDRQAEARAARAHKIAVWESMATELRLSLQAESKKFEWRHPSISAAQSHLARAPEGAFTTALAAVLDDARREREIEEKRTAEETVRLETEKIARAVQVEAERKAEEAESVARARERAEASQRINDERKMRAEAALKPTPERQ